MESLTGILAAALVVGLAAATGWFLRRGGANWRAGLGTARRGRRMQALERLPLSPQHALHLVRLGDRVLVVAVSPGGVGVLTETPWNSLEAPGGMDRIS